MGIQHIEPKDVEEITCSAKPTYHVQCVWFLLQLDRCAQRVSLHAWAARREMERLDGKVSQD